MKITNYVNVDDKILKLMKIKITIIRNISINIVRKMWLNYDHIINYSYNHSSLKLKLLLSYSIERSFRCKQFVINYFIIIFY